MTSAPAAKNSNGATICAPMIGWLCISAHSAVSSGPRLRSTVSGMPILPMSCEQSGLHDRLDVAGGQAERDGEPAAPARPRARSARACTDPSPRARWPVPAATDRSRAAAGGRAGGRPRRTAATAARRRQGGAGRDPIRRTATREAMPPPAAALPPVTAAAPVKRAWSDTAWRPPPGRGRCPPAGPRPSA